MSNIVAKVLIVGKLVIFFAIVWITLITALFSSCAHKKERSTSKMPNLNISTLRARNISINLIQYRNLYENDPTHAEDWKIVIFDEAIGFGNGNIVLVAQGFYLVDGDTLIHICPISDQETTNDRIIPYLQSKIDREALIK